MVKGVIIARKNDGMIFCEVIDQDEDTNLKVVRTRAHEFLKTMRTKRESCTVNIESLNYVFHYKLNDNIVYLVIAEKKYPQKLAFCLLEELNEGFVEVRSIFNL